MTSFRRTTNLLLSLFVFGFFCSFYAEAQRVRGKRMRGGEKTDSLHRDSLALDSLGMDSLAADTTKKKNRWMHRLFMKQAIRLSLRKRAMHIFMEKVK